MRQAVKLRIQEKRCIWRIMQRVTGMNLMTRILLRLAEMAMKDDPIGFPQHRAINQTVMMVINVLMNPATPVAGVAET